ncbi:hypothetical protein CCR97_04140 [Rhodoplanes elegans]|uniref:DUF2190 domain-containing protein n=1 Tax=Rhodoplanes elegans TaxID=29408 RepID=A0A327KPH2_9BRAD|nr:DUF2190 family protein [Rhodoplanes elegans]MBK5957399.1 hypothetical protein [Rhodoplanes elegans]RAI39523.1 hypothetical protein CH338_09115 [Rhodoplanes elegans]
MTEPLIKSFTADAAIRGNRLVAFHASKHAAIEAASNTAVGLGVSTSTGAKAAGQVDVIQLGLAEVVAGGNLTRGARVTSDDQGRAVVVPAPAVAAATVTVFGIVQAAAVEGDIVPILVAPSAVYVPASA